MQEINWGNFKAKFNGREQETFEQLSYLLFCDEFNISSGIFRYKNQAGIETEPILVNGEWVGFQAKFYDTKISDNIDNITDSIKKAKEKNPKLQKILFYTNREFAESTQKGQKEPKYKIEIEEFATRRGIQLEWRVPSHFEAQLARDTNRTLAEHFFSLGKSMLDFLEELRQHTQSLLTPIHSTITFHGSDIKIDRSHFLKSLQTSLEQCSVVIVSGEGGVGKTALIKDFSEQFNENIPLFLFKATEFNISHVNELFRRFGMFTLADFLGEFKSINEKYIVIDSAEKLSEIEDQGAFQEFLSLVLTNTWKVIFTTRSSYLEDLTFQFVDTYRVVFQLVMIDPLDLQALVVLSATHTFKLPGNERLRDFLRRPFNLSEYLKNYESVEDATTSTDFKNRLWRKLIQTPYTRNNFHRKREACFMKIAQKRAVDGHFFVEADECEDEVLHSLEADEIIKYDSVGGGYFITHDIYEEWALDKLIETSFSRAENHRDFFQSLDTSLPIRRAFRAWLSEKLLQNPNQVKLLMDDTIPDERVANYWKDEVLVSVLLSEYSERLFHLFEKILLEDDHKLLFRVIFLLRIACKEIDETFLQSIGLQKTDGISLRTLFTRPKGSGWNSTIIFIYTHVAELGLQHMQIILPLLDDWINKHKTGETTKKASQIGLFYYTQITGDEDFRYSTRDESRDQFFRVILQGAAEITDELKTIFEEVVREHQTRHSDKHYALVKTVLTSLTESFEVVKSLPEHVLQLADLFWFQAHRSEFGPSGILVEDYFCISQTHFEYSPASAFQTPLIHLLRFFLEGTLAFILAFTNKTVTCYAQSGLDEQIEQVNVVLDDKQIKKQYISNRLWNMYRGTQVSPNLLESIHMALERWLLEYAQSATQENLEMVCKYLICNSQSASITAVVVSVVLANPQKLFTIAATLFRTKENFFYDTNRMLLDRTAKDLYGIGYGINFESRLHQDERIKTCDEPHRKLSLEDLALHYQLFRPEEVSDEEAERRRHVVWSIFDQYYQVLPAKEKETASDKTWRLYLARMDSRNMHPEVEEKDGQLVVTLNPDIEPDLKQYSDDALQKSSAHMKYLALNLWANYRFKREEEKYKQYQQYENDTQLVITETKEILEQLDKGAEEDFVLFNHSIPAYTCSVLVRDFCDRLSLEEKEFCKEGILEFASLPLRMEYYQYQSSDGTEPSIVSLPELLQCFPEEKEELLAVLLVLLLNPWREISTFALRGVLHSLWEISFTDAHNLFLGYLLLKQKYENVRAEIRKENYQQNVYQSSEKQVIDRFVQQYETELNHIISNYISFEGVKNPEHLDLEILTTAFALLPLGTTNEDHKKFIRIIFPIFSKKLFLDNDKVDSTLRHRFLEKLAHFILTSPKNEIKLYLQPFIVNFTNSKGMVEFFQTFISMEDTLHQYEAFWVVWDAFYEKIVKASRKPSSYYYSREIIRTYLLASPHWREDITEWHSLKEREKVFFHRVAMDMGHSPTVLYSLSKLLNTIGSTYLEEGISWINAMIEKNKQLVTEKLEINTVYYLENVIRRYILKNRQKIKTTIQIKNQAVGILNFLIERGSATGYLLREDIL